MIAWILFSFGDELNVKNTLLSLTPVLRLTNFHSVIEFDAVFVEKPAHRTPPSRSQ